jgi:hypothetical protein
LLRCYRRRELLRSDRGRHKGGKQNGSHCNAHFRPWVGPDVHAVRLSN